VTSRLTAPHGGPVRIVLAKVGLDGHDRGLKVVARMLRDAGAEVVYLGLRQTTETVVAAAQQEDADLIGISMHNGGHNTLAPRMVEAARAAGVTAPVIVGGIIPAADVDELKAAGVAVVLTPGASEAEVIAAINAALEVGGD
jgi:methylmalonyl-CoA mutase, C-terminal domain